LAGVSPRRGEIYLATMRAGATGRKVRPVLVLSPDVRNRWASDILVVPLSMQIRSAPTHVLLDRGEGSLPYASVAKCEQVTCLDKGVLEPRPLGRPLTDDRLHQIEDAVLIALGIRRELP